MAPVLAALRPGAAVVQRPGPGACRPPARRRSRPACPIEPDAAAARVRRGGAVRADPGRSSRRASPRSTPRGWPTTRRLLVPGEESTEQVRDRVVPALAELPAAPSSRARRAIAVLHGACLKVGLLALLGWPWELAGSLRGPGQLRLRRARPSTAVQRRPPAHVVQRDGRAVPGTDPISQPTAPLARIPRVACRATGATVRGCGAAGSASAWHAEGQGFESPQLHRVVSRDMGLT